MTPDAAIAYSIPMPIRFRGITCREGMLWRGEAGWAEWSPFLDYGDAEAATWLAAAREMAEMGFPEPVRSEIPVNVTIPAVGPDLAYSLVRESGCRTAKVKVAEPGQTIADDIARVEAVRAALSDTGEVRVDANGAWSVPEAVKALKELHRYRLEYAEQPCRTVEDLAELRQILRGEPLIAADESIRRSDDPYKVRDLRAADIAVLKVQPLGGVRACLRIAESIGMDIVVSSALETSIGIRAGVALAAALPELNHACGLNTVPLLSRDVVADPLIAVDGFLSVRDIEIDPTALDAVAAHETRSAFWHDRYLRSSHG